MKRLHGKTRDEKRRRDRRVVLTPASEEEAAAHESKRRQNRLRYTQASARAEQLQETVAQGSASRRTEDEPEVPIEPREAMAGRNSPVGCFCAAADATEDCDTELVIGGGGACSSLANRPCSDAMHSPTMNDSPAVTPGPDRRRCQVTVYDGHDVSMTYRTLSEVQSIDLQQYDFAYAPCVGRIGLRLVTGEWIEVGRRPEGQRPKGRKKWTPGNGLGPDTLKILQALQFDVPAVLMPDEIADATGIDMYREDYPNLQARIAALRGFFGDDKSAQAFIITDPLKLAYGWNQDKTWVWLEVLPAR